MRSLVLLSLLLAMLSAACGGEPNPKTNMIEFRGQCDASAVVALDDDRFLVADDEDNVLRVYRLSAPGSPVQKWDAGKFLGGKSEADLEGACRIGSRLFLITSHGRNRKGEGDPARQRFFALDFAVGEKEVEFRPVEKPYTRLLADLIAEPRLRQFRLDQAAERAPKEAGALNIEGL